MSRDDMQDVELVEPHGGGGAEGNDARPGTSAVPDPRPSVAVRAALRLGRSARRRWPVLLAAVVVVALAVGGVRVQHASAERAYLASIAGMPGILEPLDASTGELWRAETGLDLGTQWQAIGDVLVGAVEDADGLRVVALDVRSGAVRWDVLASGDGGSDGYSSPVCVPVDASSATSLVCVTGGVWVADQSDGSTNNSTQRVAVVVDVARGEVVGKHDVASQVGLTQAGEGVVVAETQPDGHVRASLRDPVTWEALWTHDGAVPVDPAAAFDGENVATYDPQVVAASGLVALSTPSGVVDVLSGSGELVEQLPGVAQDSWLLELDGRMWRSEWDTSADSGALLDLATGRTYMATGAYATASDGSLGPALLLRDDQGIGLVDLDSGERVGLAVTGRETLWTAHLLHGQVIFAQGTSHDDGAGSSLDAHDAATGALRWRTPLRGDALEAPVFAAPLTDGRHVLLLDTTEPSSDDAPAEWRLVAFSTTDGHRAWDVAVPEGVVRFLEIGGRLYGMGEAGEVVALGSRKS